MATSARLKSSPAKAKTKVGNETAKLAPKLAARAVVKAEVSPKEAATPSEVKTVSQRLLETIERRRNAANQGNKSPFGGGRRPGRRGRRPKSVEYQPEHQEDDSYLVENDYEGIEYDTGIRFNSSKDDSGLNVERFEDYDEELNFDR